MCMVLLVWSALGVDKCRCVLVRVLFVVGGVDNVGCCCCSFCLFCLMVL